MILHLIAKKAWESHPAGQPYLPDTFTADGFTHCTQGDDLMLQVANRFYKNVSGDFLVLDIDESKVTSPIKWEAPASPATPAPPATPLIVEQSPQADAIKPDAMPPEAKAEFGTGAQLPTSADTTASPEPPAEPAGSLFPHIYGPLNLDAIVAIRRAVRTGDGTFIRFVLLDATLPQGMNLKKPSELAHELVDATGEFSDALARYKDKLEAHMDELDKNIKGKLG